MELCVSFLRNLQLGLGSLDLMRPWLNALRALLEHDSFYNVIEIILAAP